LVVDPDDSVLEAVVTILRRRDHQVGTAKDLSTAQTLLQAREFDVIVADLQVAEGPDGAGLRPWLVRYKPALSRKLIWTCAVMPVEIAPEKTQGAQILQKPFKVSELLAAVDALLPGKTDPAALAR